MSLTHFVYRIATEPQFASLFRNDPERAISNAVSSLEPDSVQALIRVLGNSRLVRTLLSDSDIGPDGPADWAVPDISLGETSAGRP
jgi:hypothetical protein